MLKQLKYILNSYSDEEIEEMGFWIDCEVQPELIVIESGELGDDIVIITNKENVKVNEKVF